MDKHILLWINQDWSHPWLDFYFGWVSEKASFSLPLFIIIMLLLSKQYGRDGFKLSILLAIVIGFGDLFGNMLKYLTELPRPCLEDYAVIRRPGLSSTCCLTSTTGMPSNHALNFFAAVSFLWRVLPHCRWILVLLFIACSVAISRIYLATHYPSQVLIGVLLGIAIGTSFAYLGRRKLPLIQQIQTSTHRKKDPNK